MTYTHIQNSPITVTVIQIIEVTILSYICCLYAQYNSTAKITTFCGLNKRADAHLSTQRM